MKRNVKISPTVINRVKFQIQILLEGPENRSLFFFRAHFTTHKLFHFSPSQNFDFWKNILAFVYKFEKTETPESIDIRVCLVHAIYVVASLEPLLSISHSNSKKVKIINKCRKINTNPERFSYSNNANTSDKTITLWLSTALVFTALSFQKVNKRF